MQTGCLYKDNLFISFCGHDLKTLEQPIKVVCTLLRSVSSPEESSTILWLFFRYDFQGIIRFGTVVRT